MMQIGDQDEFKVAVYTKIEENVSNGNHNEVLSCFQHDPTSHRKLKEWIAQYCTWNR
jgi:hypothetical protein